MTELSIERSAPTPALDAALARAIARVEPVEKSSRNEFHKFDYAGADAVVEEARIMAAEGLSAIQQLVRLRPVTGGDESYFADAIVTYRVAHGGESLLCTMEWPLIKERGRPADKALAGALTTAYKYFLRALLMIVRKDADEMDARDDRPREKPPLPSQPVAQPANSNSDAEWEKEVREAYGKCATVRAIQDELNRRSLPTLNAYRRKRLVELATERKEEVLKETQGAA